MRTTLLTRGEAGSVSGKPFAPHSAVDASRVRIAIGVLAIGIAWASLPFLAGLAGAVVLATSTTSIHRRMAPRLGARTAALLLTILAALLLVTPGAVLLATTVREAPDALQRILTSGPFQRLSTLHVGTLDVGSQLAEIGRALVGAGSAGAIATAGSITQSVINLLLALVGMYYLLPSGAHVWRHVREVIPFSTSASSRLAERFTSVTEAAVLGILATAISQGLTVGIAFRLVSLPNPLFWGAVTALVSILPILGSALVWAPAVAVLWLDGRPTAAGILAVVGVVVCSNVDNVVRPIIYRRVSGLHPMTSLLGAFAGMQVMGLMGVLIGPLAIMYCLELVSLYRQEYPSTSTTG
jgi:predicted PurR-regulated permease PerM